MDAQNKAVTTGETYNNYEWPYTEVDLDSWDSYGIKSASWAYHAGIFGHTKAMCKRSAVRRHNWLKVLCR